MPRPAVKWKNTDLLPTEMFLPDPSARTELSATDPARTAVRTCAQCVNFVSEDAVHAEYGLAAGACAAKGRLIIGNKKMAEASACKYRQSGAPKDVMTLPLLPIYASATRAEEVMLEKLGIDIIEPLDYVSDKTVTIEEESKGIKAWRAISDPEGTDNVVYLPIFRPEIFTKDQAELIPKTGDEEGPEYYVDYGAFVYQAAILWMELDETPAGWGMPGIGKTEFGRHMAWLMQVPFYRFSIKPSTELYELEGSKEYSPEAGTFFTDGRFTKAWANISVVMVDEPNMGQPDVWAFLRPCMDNSKKLVIDADAGRIVARNEFCFPILSMNPAWSPLNVGTNPIGAADASRLMHLDFFLPEEAIERKIISSRVLRDGWIIDTQRLDLVMKVSANIRDLCDNGTLSMTWGIRETIKVSRSLRFFDPLVAFKIAVGNYLEPAQKDTLLDQVRAARSATPLPKVKLIEDK
jgi:MoxR-like ATPase